jgi:uncharacterized membrane protein
MAEITVDTRPVPRHSLVTLTHVLYAMHAFSALMGLLTPAFIVTSFLAGWPSIIAVIVNLIKRDDVRGTYLESHFNWQLRTFGYALLWLVVMVLVLVTIGIPLTLVTLFVGLPIAVVFAIGLGIWVLYRIARGWLALIDGKPIRVMV